MKKTNEAKRVEREEGHGNYLKERERRVRKNSLEERHKNYGITFITHCN